MFFVYQNIQKFPLLLPSHNCIIITMFSFQGAVLNLFLRNSMKFLVAKELQSISYGGD